MVKLLELETNNFLYTTAIGDLEVSLNPSYREFQALIYDAKWRELRGLLSEEGDLYVWDAFMSVHNDVIHRLGLPDNFIKLYLKKNQIEVYLDGRVVDENKMYDFVDNAPSIKTAYHVVPEITISSN